MLRILSVDDEVPALEELTYLLRRDARVTDVEPVRDGAAALLALDRSLAEGRPFGALFLDVRMPGLDGTAVARVASRFADPPSVVFVTAHDDFAVDAFALRAVDYLLKPIHPDRLAEAVRRVAAAHAGRAAAEDATAHDPAVAQATPATPADTSGAAPPADEVIPVELAGVTRFVRRSDVIYVEAQGDYARLHTAGGSHLVRTPLAALEERWADAGFIRIHRRHLVAVRHVRELRLESGRAFVRVGGFVLPISRRHTRGVREVLVRVGPDTAPGFRPDGGTAATRAVGPTGPPGPLGSAGHG
ncbi:LytR/AlgR family response regulator transcription factor [Yinghuangia sp. YIM S09857]|uniref:LytR/AlgR family response regulator transcription factor n=1 Tax=Yinghuangia sp. YIM S09857 TaxID=3436929 RepID=UPI003F52E15C